MRRIIRTCAAGAPGQPRSRKSSRTRRRTGGAPKPAAETPGQSDLHQPANTALRDDRTRRRRSKTRMDQMRSADDRTTRSSSSPRRTIEQEYRSLRARLRDRVRRVSRAARQAAGSADRAEPRERPQGRALQRHRAAAAAGETGEPEPSRDHGDRRDPRARRVASRWSWCSELLDTSVRGRNDLIAPGGRRRHWPCCRGSKPPPTAC